MKNFLKSKKFKYLLILFITLLIIVLSLLVFKNLFSNSNADRFEGIENYKLTNDEINSIKESFAIDNANIDVYVKSKIIRIYIELEEDFDFDTIKQLSNNSLTNIKEENLKYYDIEVFVESKNEESTVYPKIGYKHKTNSQFIW